MRLIGAQFRLFMTILVTGLLLTSAVAFAGPENKEPVDPRPSFCNLLLSGFGQSVSENRFARLIEMLIRGVPSEVMFLLRHPGDVLGDTPVSSGHLPITRRGPWRYLYSLGLFPYDFTNKKILDVASGESLFPTMINRVYGDTGTVATALDPAATRGFRDDVYVRGSAFHLPFANETYDLVTSMWFLNNIWYERLRDSDSDAIPAVKEMIRVTKSGGQVRFYHSLYDLGNQDAMKEFLKNHPRVKQFRITPPILFNGSYIIDIE